jgi:hypothetical protein
MKVSGCTVAYTKELENRVFEYTVCTLAIFFVRDMNC